MKRFFCICVLYVLLLSIPIGANASLSYKILTSSEETSLYHTKQEVLKILDTLLIGVKEESYVDIVKENIDCFYWQEDMKVYFKKNTLYIILEDGKGKVIHGEYEKKNVCFEEVKPKSILKEWWKNAKE